MLFPIEKFTNSPVMSLQTGSELGRTVMPIIDPSNLTIVAFSLQGPSLDYDPTLLRVDDIREVGPIGMIIDSSDELIGANDVIKIQDILNLEFGLIGLKVVDEKKKTVGRIIGYTLDSSSFTIQQLRVKRPLIQSLGDTELLIHRSQIIKITDNLITVKSSNVRHKDPVVEPTNQVFENPFRKPQQTSPETINS